MGVSDLTGELMRFAITAIARRGGRQKAGEVSDFVRHCKAGEYMSLSLSCRLRIRITLTPFLSDINPWTDFDGFTPYVKNLGKKQAVTAQSLMKIEDGASHSNTRISTSGALTKFIHSFVRSSVAAYAIAVRASEYAGSEDILEDIVERCVLDVRSKRYDAYEGGGGHGEMEYRDGEGYSDMFA